MINIKATKSLNWTTSFWNIKILCNPFLLFKPFQHVQVIQAGNILQFLVTLLTYFKYYRKELGSLLVLELLSVGCFSNNLLLFFYLDERIKAIKEKKIVIKINLHWDSQISIIPKLWNHHSKKLLYKTTYPPTWCSTA